MKVLENNWRYKTLENLEKNVWANHNSYYRLVNRVSALRKVPLSDFSVEDMRLMIGQNEGLDYLIPLAIEALTNDVLAEGDMYEGDLLQSVVLINPVFWKKNEGYWSTINGLIKSNLDAIRVRNIELNRFLDM
jgi:hypothetical protein